MTEQICLKPTSMDFEILKRLKAYLNLEGRRYFSADDLYRLGLVRLLPSPHNRTVGAWFARMQHARAILDTGDFVPSLRVSNNSRRIKRYDAFPERGSVPK
jgi:hypothetical protein